MRPASRAVVVVGFLTMYSSGFVVTVMESSVQENLTQSTSRPKYWCQAEHTDIPTFWLGVTLELRLTGGGGFVLLIDDRRVIRVTQPKIVKYWLVQ